MSMPRIRAREVLLLVLPVVLLGMAGWHLSRRPTSRDVGPLRMVIDETKVIPTNPREMYDGYDTKAVLIAHSEGTYAEPSGGHLTGLSYPSTRNVRLVAVKNGKEKVLADSSNPNKQIFRQINAVDSPRFTAAFWMRLSALPTSIGEIRVTGELTNAHGYFVRNNQGNRIYSVKFNPTPFDVVVKKADAKVTVPKVSLEQPFSVVRQSISRDSAGATWGVHLSVKPANHLMRWGKRPRIYWSRVNAEESAYLTDQKGQRYYEFMDNTGTMKKISFHRIVGYEKYGEYEVSYKFPAARLPKGRLTFHTTVSVNECWPSPIEVVVREK
jgi:hypothetical protein